VRERVFVTRRQTGWERLEVLLDRASKKGIGSLQATELQELALLYRATTTDLAAAKSRAYSPDLTAYLNRLTARAYAYVHAGTATGGWSKIALFLTTTFPREVRHSGKIILATSTLFVLAAIVAYWLVSARPSNAYAILPGAEIPTITKSLHDSNFAFDRSYAPEMSTEIITNNIQVSMIAFAGGITTLGVLTLWEILNNGLMVGGLGALFSQKGFGLDFWATIAPHGFIELTSIQIAGAAGLQLALAVIAPGRMRRIDALKIAGRRAGVLMIGVACLLVVAGTIEGFVTPQRTSIPFRFGVGLVTGVLLAAYFAFAGRTQNAKQMPDLS
jgi:uncharacterized membrane protein SpoIIM required for sporulation